MDTAAALSAHERAYRLARHTRDEAASARLALELGFDCLVLERAVEASGWLELAGQLLDRLALMPEHSLLAYLRANRALNGEHDPPARRRDDRCRGRRRGGRSRGRGDLLSPDRRLPARA
jgi:hypothetical protein